MTTLCVNRVARPAAGPPAGVVQEVRVGGELDLATAATVAATLRAAIAARPSTVVIDLSGVTFCDSTGLRPLTDAVRRGRHAGIAIVFVEVPDCIARLRRLLAARAGRVAPGPLWSAA